ncbi:hypothetical protein [Butyricimonas hominis]|uniref:Uncharacterized protein n=1 Tax=Butyricimonas hominis TaxID=2763032 RepID=A0ABR7D7G9_9BACT|nr:hypothetical protein [Butyricimonas hominis]MBC5623749.1 hypothetical protein [Butyricimonas hominis]
MEASKISFDDNYTLNIFSEYLNKNLMVVISDELEASEEELTLDYRSKIAAFINDTPTWYNQVCQEIIKWVKLTYNISIESTDIELMIIFILFEQSEKELFGLDFRLTVDAEHGCGIQLKINNGHYEIAKIGIADIALG